MNKSQFLGIEVTTDFFIIFYKSAEIQNNRSNKLLAASPNSFFVKYLLFYNLQFLIKCKIKYSIMNDIALSTFFYGCPFPNQFENSRRTFEMLS